jgi:acetate---CoA ligase (ADP-forming)
MTGPVSSLDRAMVVIEKARAAGRTTLSEHEAKEVLSAYGIPVTVERIVTDLDGLEEAMDAIGFPAVLKIDSPDILHKTDAGLVALGCATRDQARTAFERILRLAEEAFPVAAINGVLVQEMIVDPVAECIVGMKKDPQFGPTVMFGLGGVFVEVFGDVALRVAPFSSEDAAEMMRETKGYKLLIGARGRQKADLRAVEDVLLNVSRLALELESQVSEIDINPLMVGADDARAGRSAVAVDALILLDGLPDQACG